MAELFLRNRFRAQDKYGHGANQAGKAKSVMSTSDDQFELFVDLCCDIYNILRENATLLVSLCSLAIPCNLPELQTEKDLMWLYDKLLIGKTDEEASEDFRKQIDISLRCRTTRLNDAAHMIAHA